jgi:WD40 repeat protein
MSMLPWLPCLTATLALVVSSACRAEPPPLAETTPLRLDRHGDPLPPGAVARLGSMRLRHGGQVNRIVFSPTEQGLISAGQDGVVRFWDPASGREVRRLRDRLGTINTIAVSADGKTLALGGNGLIRLWDARTGKESRRFAAGEEMLWLLAFGPDAQTVIAASGDGMVRVYDTAGKLLHHCGDRGEMECVAVSPDGKVLATNGPAGSLRLWDVATGRELRGLAGHPGAAVTALAFAPKGNLLASGARDDTVRLWSLSEGKELRSLPGHAGEVLALAWSPDGRALVSAAADRTIRLWDLAAGKESRRLDVDRDVRALAVAPDGKTFASAAAGSVIRLWDTATGRQRLASGSHQTAVLSVAFAPDGKQLASGSEDGTVLVWDAAAAKEVRSLDGPPGGVAALAFAPDGKVFVAVGAHGPLRLWPVAAGAPAAPLRPGVFRALAFAPDGKTVAAGKDAAVLLFTGPNGKEAQLRLGREEEVGALAFTPDGQLLATNSPQAGTRLWDMTARTEIRRLEGSGAATALAFTANGKWLIAADRQGGLALWRVATGKEKRKLTAPHGPVIFALSPDGRTVAEQALAGPDRAIRLVEVLTGRERRRLAGHSGGALALAFSPDSKRLASAGEDTAVLLWDVIGAPPDSKALAPGELGPLWDDLAGGDAARAYRATAALVAAPGQAVALIRRRLEPFAAPESARLEQLIRDLCGERFRPRQQAAQELERLGELAEPALQKLLVQPPSLEAHRRAERLLARIEEPALSAGRLQALRAVQVLEHIGTAEARQLLERLAGGAAGAGLTREAEAALRRLRR